MGKVKEKRSPVGCGEELKLEQFSQKDNNEYVDEKVVVVLFVSNQVVRKDISQEGQGEESGVDGVVEEEEEEEAVVEVCEGEKPQLFRPVACMLRPVT